MLEQIKAFFDTYFPRFITEYVVCYEDGDGNLEPKMSIGQYEEEYFYDPITIPDGVVKMRSFNLFGYGIAPKQIGEPMTYKEYLMLTEEWL